MHLEAAFRKTYTYIKGARGAEALAKGARQLLEKAAPKEALAQRIQHVVGGFPGELPQSISVATYLDKVKLL